MKILTWNIQATKGCDDQYDLNRICSHIKSYGDLDVICLQEVSRNIPDQNGDDQPALIDRAFPQHEMIWGPGFSAPAGHSDRFEFGNLTLVKPEYYRNSQLHTLPSPVVDTLQMPRTMLEVVIGVGDADDSNFSVFNTHLAFHAEVESVAQMNALTTLRNERLGKSKIATDPDSVGPYRYSKPCSDVVLCGDLNIDSDSQVFSEHVLDANWIDCWAVYSRDKNAGQREPTCGCFDAAQWPQGPHVRDYFLATENIASKTVNLQVDTQTIASDHQPVLIELNL